MIWIPNYLHYIQGLRLINHGKLVKRIALIRLDYKRVHRLVSWSSFVDLRWSISLAYASKAWLTQNLLLWRFVVWGGIFSRCPLATRLIQTKICNCHSRIEKCGALQGKEEAGGKHKCLYCMVIFCCIEDYFAITLWNPAYACEYR